MCGWLCGDGEGVCGDGCVCEVMRCVCVVMGRCVHRDEELCAYRVCRSYSTVTECSLTPSKTGIATLSPFYSKKQQKQHILSGEVTKATS